MLFRSQVVPLFDGRGSVHDKHLSIFLNHRVGKGIDLFAFFRDTETGSDDVDLLAVQLFGRAARAFGRRAEESAVLGKLNESPQITLYMEQNADEADSAVVKELLAADKRIEKSEFIGKAQGLSELQTSMGEQDIVSMLDSNPLPDAFVVSPKPGGTPSEMQALRQDLAKLPMVESAQLDTEWMQTLYQIDDFVQKVLAFLSVTLSVAFVLVAHNTIRLQILSRKEEIEITKLLGVPSSFICCLFLYQALRDRKSVV